MPACTAGTTEWKVERPAGVGEGCGGGGKWARRLSGRAARGADGGRGESRETMRGDRCGRGANVGGVHCGRGGSEEEARPGGAVEVRRGHEGAGAGDAGGICGPAGDVS